MPKAERFVLFFWLILAISILGFSQEKRILTLEDSIHLALFQNPQHLASEERVESAQSQIRQAVASFFPSLNAQGMRTLSEKVFEIEMPSFIPGQPPQKIKLDFTRDYQFSLALSIPLLPSMQSIAGFQQAKYGFLTTKEGVKLSEQITVFNTKRAFFAHLLAKEFVTVAEEAVNVAEKHYQNVKNLYEVGMASKFDLLRSEVQEANLKPQLIKARNNLKITELSLKTLLGLDLSESIEIKGELAYEPFRPDLDECLSRALEDRPEIRQLQYQKRMNEAVLKLTRFSNLPRISLSGAYNFWADRFNFQENTWQSFYAVNLVVTIPIFNGFSVSARVAQIQAELKELQHAYKGVEDAIKLEVRQAVLKLEEAKESLLSQEKNVEQAQESLRIAELNFSEGLTTTLDVSSAQAALSQAKTNYSQALYDYVIAQAQLDKATGAEWKELPNE